MDKWAYEVVGSGFLDISDHLKNGKSSLNLDERNTTDIWSKFSFKEHGRDLVAVIISPRGCWTLVSDGLNEWGNDGWELVGTTPHHYIAYVLGASHEVRLLNTGPGFPRNLEVKLLRPGYGYLFKRKIEIKEND